LGGQLIVQNRATSKAFGMAEATLAETGVDFVLPKERIADALINLTQTSVAAMRVA
jgi:chemotaxis response regulator CheB